MFINLSDENTLEQQLLMNAAGGKSVNIMEPGVDGFFISPEMLDDSGEMESTLGLLKSTEAYVNRLVDFNTRIKNAKGMSRGMALELNELVASNETFANPRRFTEEITMTGYEPSLEAITAKMWIMIAAAIAFLVTLIYKFIRWIFGTSDDKAAGGSLDDVKKGIKETGPKLERQERIVHDVLGMVKDTRGDNITINMPQAVDKNAIERSSVPDAMKKEVLRNTSNLGSSVHSEPKKQQITVRLSDVLADMRGGQQIYDFVRKPNKYARIIYSKNSPALKLVIDSFDGFKSASTIILGQLDILDEMMKTMDEDQGEPTVAGRLKVNTFLKTLDRDINNVGDIKFASHSYPNAIYWANDLRNEINTYGPAEAPFDDLEDMLVSYESAFKRVRHVDFNKMVAFIEALKRAEPALLKLERYAHKQKLMKNAGELSDADDERAAILMRVHRSIANNLLGLMKVYSHIARVYVEVGKHGYNIVQTLTKNAAHVIAFYNKYKDHPPPTLVMLHEQLQESSREFKDNLVQEHLVAKHVSIGDVKYSFSFGDDDDDESIRSGTMSAAGARDIMGKIGGK